MATLKLHFRHPELAAGRGLNFPRRAIVGQTYRYFTVITLLLLARLMMMMMVLAVLLLLVPRVVLLLLLALFSPFVSLQSIIDKSS